MKIRAERVRPGDAIEGSTVVWAMPLPDHSAILLGLAPPRSRGEPHFAITRRLRPEELIEVDDRVDAED